jgi:hypothetical protein
MDYGPSFIAQEVGHGHEKEEYQNQNLEVTQKS